MKKILKIGLGVGVTTALALAVGVPVFREVNSDDLVASDLSASAVRVFEADEDTVDAIVTEETTEEAELTENESEDAAVNESEESSASESEEISNRDSEENSNDDSQDNANVAPDDIIEVEANHCVDYHYATDEELEAYMEYIDSIDWDALSEECENLEFDIDKYDDEELRSIAQDYLDQGYYLMDSEFVAKRMLSGTAAPLYDEAGNEIGERFFTNGFDVVDDNNGNNTFYIQVLKLTPEDFDMLMAQDHTFDDVEASESGDENVLKYESSDEFADTTITYNTETGIYTIKTVFTDAAANAEG